MVPSCQSADVTWQNSPCICDFLVGVTSSSNCNISTNYCKSFKCCVGFILWISRVNCFCGIKYHERFSSALQLCNNSKSLKLNSNELMVMEKTAKYNTRKISGFYSIWHNNFIKWRNNFIKRHNNFNIW